MTFLIYIKVLHLSKTNIMIKKYFISAYATSPSFYEWDGSAESDYFKKLADNSNIIGIEHPYLLESNKYPLDWLVKNVPSHWKLIITSLPLFMQLTNKNPKIGLASTSEKDRCLAVSLIDQIRQYAEKLNNLFGRNIVESINLYSSPKNSDQCKQGSKEGLEHSLIEIIKMNWGDIVLNIEHCDAYIYNHVPDKGFLVLDEEIDVIKQVGKLGIILNWGRSAIELHSINGPLNHINLTKKHDLLKGFVFSGCTDQSNSPYGAWKDTHIPPKKLINSQYLREESLLGKEEILQVFNLINNQDIYLGIKVLDPSSMRDVDRSIGLNLETLSSIENTWNYHCSIQ